MSRTSTWSNIGCEVKSKTLEEVLVEAHLDYTVKSKNAFVNFGGKYVEIPNRKAIVRDDGYVYQVLSPNYTPVQNKDAFDFINYINEDVTFLRAGETYTGMVYIIGALPEVNVLGDKFVPHIIFQNSHNGAYSLATAICPLRIVCQNQFNIAFEESNSSFLIRHTKNIESKMRIAADTMKNISNYMKVFNEKAELFAAQKVTSKQIEQFLDFMFPIKEDASEKLIERVEFEKNSFLKAYNSDDNSNFLGSAWGLINGLTDYITHKDYRRKVEHAEEKKFMETVVKATDLNKSMYFLSNLALTN